MESSKRGIVFDDIIGGDAKRLRRSSTNEGDEVGRDADATETGNALREIVAIAKPSPIGDSRTQSNKISIELVCQTLELELESDDDLLVRNSAEHHLQNINCAAELSTLYKYVAAEYVPFLKKRLLETPQSESTISAEECTRILNGLQTLKVFLGSMAPNNKTDFYESAPSSLKRSLEQAFDEEKRYIDALSSFIDVTCEVLNFWKILSDYQFSSLPQDEQNELAACTFRDLIVLRVDPCVLLIKLANSFLNESTTANLDLSKLRDICSNWFRRLLDEVMDKLRSTQACIGNGEREEIVCLALQWFGHLVPHIQLNDDFVDELLAIPNRSAGDFLIRSVLVAPDNIKLVNVLWKYYERNGRHSAATKILEELSSVPNAHQNLSDRIEYLERAVNDGHCFGVGISMRNIADTLEVANVQKTILDSLSTMPNHDVQLACGRLNQQLFTINQLYSDFVKQFDLSECKSEIFQHKILQTICIEEKELIDLNDDCLLAIFELLTLSDLTAVAEVSQRFRAIAQESFRLSKPVLRIPKDVRFSRHPSSPLDEDKVQIVQRTSQVLRNFGSLVTDIEINLEDRWVEKKVFRLLTKHCGESLTTLQMVSGSERLPDWMRPIIENLKKFVSVNVHLDSSIFAWLSKIEHLGIIQNGQIPPPNALLKLKFEKLERFSLCTRAKVECSDLAMFLQKHKGLKEVELQVENDSKSLDLFGDDWSAIEKLGTNLSIKASVFKHLKNLESLEFSDQATSYDEAEEILREIIVADAPLKHLGLTLLSWPGPEIRESFDAILKLEHLVSFSTYDVEMMIQLSPQLVRLNELEITILYQKFSKCFTGMKKLVKSFPNLQRLAYNISTIVVDWVFDSNLFLEIVAVLEERPDPNKKPLHLTLRGDCSMEISNDLKQQHRHILTVSAVDENPEFSIMI